jgi:hypothetical protein
VKLLTIALATPAGGGTPLDLLAIYLLIDRDAPLIRLPAGITAPR